VKPFGIRLTSSGWNRADPLNPGPSVRRLPERGESEFRSFRQCARQDGKPANGRSTAQTRSLSSEDKAKKDSLKLNERSQNVYENKGSPWKTQERGWNAYENKGSYPVKARMLLKRKVVNRWQVITEGLLPTQSPPLHRHDHQAPGSKLTDHRASEESSVAF